MTSAAAAVRELAMARATAPHPVTLILDDTLRSELEQARSALDALQDRRRDLAGSGDQPPAAPTSLADAAPPADGIRSDIDRMITAAQRVVDAIEAEAVRANLVMVINVRRLTPDRYQARLEEAEKRARADARKDKNTNENALFLRNLGDALLQDGYHGSTTADGDDLGLTLEDLTAGPLNHADLENLRDHAITINRAGQTVPFNRRSSGVPATS